MAVTVRMDARSISRAATQVRRASPIAWKACRVALLEVGNSVAADIKQAASFSDRIPDSVKVRVTGGGNIKIIVGGDEAPDAVPIENAGKGFVRHPEFGHRNRWTAKNSRPAYILPAYARRQEWALERMERAYWDAYVAAFESRGIV